jgi:hypothetical protein
MTHPGLEEAPGPLSVQSLAPWCQRRYVTRMAVTTERAGRPAGLQASTVAEAFQMTAQAHPDRCALRTKGDEFSISWREYAEKVRRRPVPFSVMERAGVVGFMLVILIFLVGLSNDIGRLSGEGFQVR